MSTRMRVVGLDDALEAFDRLGKAGKKEGSKAVRASLEQVRTTSIKKIQRDPKTGRTYERGPGANASSVHKASAPGEAPATDTGRLASSIKVIHKELIGSVGSKLNYSFWLEYGTFKMGARPFLRPALEDNQKYILNRFTAALEQATKEFYGR